MRCSLLWLLALLSQAAGLRAADEVAIGMNYPESGPYMAIGVDEERGAQLALDEINASGGILGRQVRVLGRDSKSDPDLSASNVEHLIDERGVRMVFGGASSAVAIRVGEVCQRKRALFMATVTSANETTGINGHRHTFRASYSAWMGGKALGTYLKKHYPPSRNKYFFIVADYSWGRSAEESIRRFSGAEDRSIHRASYTRFPGVTRQSFQNKMKLARIVGADVLVLCHFGAEMTMAARVASEMGLKQRMRLVVPILELSICEGAGPEAMEGIIGTSDFNWKVPYALGRQTGIQFVERFEERYGRYPCWGAAKAYTILWEYKRAVERAGSFRVADVIRSLEGSTFSLLKDEERWRDFDHQAEQTVFLVKCNPKAKVLSDKYKLDYFEIIDTLPGRDAVRSREEWNRARVAAGLLPRLEALEDERATLH